ncbi:MAG: HIT domain-containing protein, partial [bacterium]
RQHLASMNEIGQADEALTHRLAVTAARIAAQEGLAERGYRLVVNAGPEAGQTVAHLHVHLLGGRQMTWPPG